MKKIQPLRNGGEDIEDLLDGVHLLSISTKSTIFKKKWVGRWACKWLSGYMDPWVKIKDVSWIADSI